MAIRVADTDNCNLDSANHFTAKTALSWTSTVQQTSAPADRRVADLTPVSAPNMMIRRSLQLGRPERKLRELFVGNPTGIPIEESVARTEQQLAAVRSDLSRFATAMAKNWLRAPGLQVPLESTVQLTSSPLRWMQANS